MQPFQEPATYAPAMPRVAFASAASRRRPHECEKTTYRHHVIPAAFAAGARALESAPAGLCVRFSGGGLRNDRLPTGRAKKAARQGLHLAGPQKPAITYSRPVRTTIGRVGLTTEFGMGSGVAPHVSSPAARVREKSKVASDEFKVNGPIVIRSSL
jgi:hypothetical protein